MESIRAICLISLLLMAHGALARPVTVADLDWLTGSWAGAVGDQVLEEIWTAPRGNTLAALVRMGTDAGISMMEMIIIHENEGETTLRMQQFGPDYTPRFPAPHALRLESAARHTATFTTDEPGGIQKIVYLREDDRLTVTVTLPDGSLFIAPLSAR